jgi:hypothetical protein
MASSAWTIAATPGNDRLARRARRSSAPTGADRPRHHVSGLFIGGRRCLLRCPRGNPDPDTARPLRSLPARLVSECPVRPARESAQGASNGHRRSRSRIRMRAPERRFGACLLGTSTGSPASTSIGCPFAERRAVSGTVTALLLLVLSSHDLGAAATHNRCCVRTKAAARVPAPMRTARAIPIVRHGAGRTGPARSPRRPYGVVPPALAQIIKAVAREMCIFRALRDSRSNRRHAGRGGRRRSQATFASRGAASDTVGTSLRQQSVMTWFW